MYFPPLKSYEKPKKRSPGPEKLIQRAICESFRLKYRIALVHIDSGGASFRSGRSSGAGGYSPTPAGFPDLVGVIPPTGRGLYIEVKAPGKKPTELQNRYLALLQAKGAIAFWADSVESAIRQYEEAANAACAEAADRLEALYAVVVEAIEHHRRSMFEYLTEEEKADVILRTRKYDLTEKFQRAIDENTTFILPKGRYRVDGPITIKDKK
jgi:hypothetical protein